MRQAAVGGSPRTPSPRTPGRTPTWSAWVPGDCGTWPLDGPEVGPGGWGAGSPPGGGGRGDLYEGGPGGRGRGEWCPGGVPPGFWAQGGAGGLAPWCPGGKGRAPGGLPRKGPGDERGEGHREPATARKVFKISQSCGKLYEKNKNCSPG